MLLDLKQLTRLLPEDVADLKGENPAEMVKRALLFVSGGGHRNFFSHFSSKTYLMSYCNVLTMQIISTVDVFFFLLGKTDLNVFVFVIDFQLY